MEQHAQSRRSITDDIGRLLRAFPDVRNLPDDDPTLVAWLHWKRALIGEIRLLELRERMLAGSEDLWIELNREEQELAGFGIDDLRDTRADQR